MKHACAKAAVASISSSLDCRPQWTACKRLCKVLPNDAARLVTQNPLDTSGPAPLITSARGSSAT
jgi:hypothetical protein